MKTISYNKERVQNIILYFVEKKNSINFTYLSKLLYFSDMFNYIYRGNTITDLKYTAQEIGPIPKRIYSELVKKMKKKYKKYELYKIIDCKNIIGKNTVHNYSCFLNHNYKIDNYLIVKKNKKFNPIYFSPNELDTMDRVSKLFDTNQKIENDELIYTKSQPWKRTWAGGSGKGRTIEFNIELDSCDDLLKNNTYAMIEKSKAAKSAVQEL
ncbi:type II toxin-antitoxin system antitoxin SocA domain-containing protein [uncultured Desulfovibrio sp.]|uniref:type II toxin-antitoxin system antitoxin SocA domain-containing protein n=1 Tax=uncultured Desulfovibrio sp. TaxID=167968 RepID=UPI0028050BC7|nr:type II toxin-antitoxin system antitoxin SocA domain-containing protein [uncultured Desulfovibrio sp.]